MTTHSAKGASEAARLISVTAGWVFVFTMLIGVVSLVSSYDTRTNTDQQRLDHERAVEQRSRCEVALRIQYQQHSFPFDDSGHEQWTLPAECEDFR